MRAALGYDRSYTTSQIGIEMTNTTREIPMTLSQFNEAGKSNPDYVDGVYVGPEARFVGMIGLDGGGDDLNTRMTHPMSRSEVFEWYKASREYFAMMVRHDATMREVTVSIFDSRDLNSIDAEPVSIACFRK